MNLYIVCQPPFFRGKLAVSFREGFLGLPNIFQQWDPGIQVDEWVHVSDPIHVYWVLFTWLDGGFKYFYFHPYLGKWSNLAYIFQMGWNHQLGAVYLVFGLFWSMLLKRHSSLTIVEAEFLAEMISISQNSTYFEVIHPPMISLCWVLRSQSEHGWQCHLKMHFLLQMGEFPMSP